MEEGDLVKVATPPDGLQVAVQTFVPLGFVANTGLPMWSVITHDFMPS